LLGTAPEYFDAHIDEIDRKDRHRLRAGHSPWRSWRDNCAAWVARTLADREEYRITAPTLVIAGEQDMLIPACYARQMAHEIPGSEFLVVRGCGHNPFVEKPDQVVPRIEEFLMRSRGKSSRDSREAQLATEETV
jgi:pimeloyl-ACP methyl ester carboxylesterase